MQAGLRARRIGHYRNRTAAGAAAIMVAGARVGAHVRYRQWAASGRSTDFEPVERELRFALPYWCMVAVLVNEAGGDARLSRAGRPARWCSTLPPRRADERARGCAHRALPGERHQVPRRARERLSLARSPPRAAAGSCARSSAASRATRARATSTRWTPTTEPSQRPATDGLPVPPPEMVALVAGWIEPQEFERYGKYAATWIAEMLARNGVDPRGAGHGPRLRLRLRPRDPPLAARSRTPGCTGPTTTRTSCGGARRTCRSRDFRVNGLEPPLPYRRRLVRLRVRAVDLHAPRRRPAVAVDGGAHAGREAGRVFLLPTFHGRSRLEYMRTEGQYERIAPGLRGGRAGRDRLRAGGQQRVRRLPPRAIHSRRAWPRVWNCSTSRPGERWTSSRTPCCSASPHRDEHRWRGGPTA